MKRFEDKKVFYSELRKKNAFYETKVKNYIGKKAK